MTLVELRHPWARDVITDGELADHVPAEWRSSLREQGIRPVAIRRDLRRRDRAQTIRLFHVQGGPGRIPSRAASGGGRSRISGPCRTPPPTSRMVGRDRRHLVLVCTNGRHDPCCATFGRPLVRHLRHADCGDDVWECSHIGGDRFMANLVVLPQGLYFGRVTVDWVDALLDGLQRRLDLDMYRGRSTLTYIAQAAEHFTRRQLGLTAVDAIVGVRRSADHVDVELQDGGVIRVRLLRTLTPAPTPLTCKARPDESYPTYRLVNLVRIH